ncbi:jg23849, partial [Pararge aegeria aegeria]
GRLRELCWEYDQIINEEIRRRTRVTNVAQRVAKLTGGSQSSENQWLLGFQGAGMATPHRNTKNSWSTPPRGGKTTSSKSLGAAGNKRPRTFCNSLQKTQQLTSKHRFKY